MSEIHNLSRDELMKRVYWYEKKYSPYIEKKGLHNWKNLFRKPTLYEWVILIMILTALFMGWAYLHDVEECRKIVAEWNAFLNPGSNPGRGFNLTNYSTTGSLRNWKNISEGVQNDLVE